MHFRKFNRLFANLDTIDRLLRTANSLYSLIGALNNNCHGSPNNSPNIGKELKQKTENFCSILHQSFGIYGASPSSYFVQRQGRKGNVISIDLCIVFNSFKVCTLDNCFDDLCRSRCWDDFDSIWRARTLHSTPTSLLCHCLYFMFHWITLQFQFITCSRT